MMIFNTTTQNVYVLYKKQLFTCMLFTPENSNIVYLCGID